MTLPRASIDRWANLFPTDRPAFEVGDRLWGLVHRWEALPCNLPGSDKTWVERSIRDHEAVIRAAVPPP